MIRWGKCGHPLHPTQGCRVCWTAEHTAEACNARATKTAPPSFSVKVTKVSGGNRVTTDPSGGVIAAADVSGFVEGQPIEFVDYATKRYEERERYRGREHEAHLYSFSMHADEAARVLNLVGAHPSIIFAQLKFVFGAVYAAHDNNNSVYIVIVHGAPVEQSHVDFVLALRRRNTAGPWIAWPLDGGEPIGRTRREVDEAIARICPPESRGEDDLDAAAEPIRYRYLGHFVPSSIYDAILEHNPASQRFSPGLAETIAKTASSAFAAAINKDSPLVGK